MTYIPNSTWVDGVSPLTAARVQKFDDGLVDVDGRVTSLSTTKADKAAALRDRFTSKANAVPTTADSGQGIVLVDNGTTGAGLSIVSGKLTNTSTSATAASGYYTVNVGANVTTLGARFTLSAGSGTAGNACLAVWQTSLAASFPTIPNSPFHLSIFSWGWQLGVWQANALRTIQTTNFASPLATDDTTVLEVWCAIDYTTNTARIVFPDGSIGVVTDASISAANAGPWANFEVYVGNATTDNRAKFVDLWADPLSAQRNAVLSVHEATRFVPQVVSGTVSSLPVALADVYYAPALRAVINIPAAFADIVDTVNTPNTTVGITLTVPPSQKIRIDVEVSIKLAAANTYTLGIYKGGTFVQARQVLDTQQFSGRVRTSFLLSGQAPGAATYTVRHVAGTAVTDGINGLIIDQSLGAVPIITASARP